MTDPRPAGSGGKQVPNWVVLGGVGVFLVLSGLITMLGGMR